MYEINPGRQFPWMADAIRRGRVLPITGPDTLPVKAVQDQASWAAADQEPAVLVPARVGGAPRYVLVLECTCAACAWPDRLVARMQISAWIIASTLERMRADNEIRQHVPRLAEAQRIADLGNWEWNLLTDELQWSDEVYRIFGLCPGEFDHSINMFWNLVHHEDLGDVREQAQPALNCPRGIYTVDHRIIQPDGTRRMVRELGTPDFDQDGRAVRLNGPRSNCRNSASQPGAATVIASKSVTCVLAETGCELVSPIAFAVSVF
jgi:PAS domain-containing protein